jgi:hypothetical protein
MVQRVKRFKFYDSGKPKSDYFTFWFIDKKEFENKILKQTLIPYLKGEDVDEG